jgi:hypothetical protein
MCGIPNMGESLEEYVPFPDPGGPMKIIFFLSISCVLGINMSPQANSFDGIGASYHFGRCLISSSPKCSYCSVRSPDVKNSESDTS